MRHLPTPHRAHPRRLGRGRAALAAVAASLGLVLLAATAPAVAQPGARPGNEGGQLVLVGGSLKDGNAEVYGEIVRRAGGPGSTIGVITAASQPESQDPDAGTPDASNSVANGEFYVDLLDGYGADAVYVPVDLDHVAAADDQALAEQVRRYDGFFFGGGDQYRLVQTLQRGANQKDSAVLAAIRDAFEDGAVVAGTSAGAQIQAGANMVTGGESWEALTDGSAEGYFDDATKLGYLPRGGFGFFRSGLLDTHFTAYGREGRAVRLASDTRERRVFGLDPNTALVVDRAGTAHEELSVLGQRGISVVDLSRAKARTDAQGRWGIDGVRWSWLTSGDRFDPRSGIVVPSGDTSPLARTDRDVGFATADVFASLRGTSSGFELVSLARDLVATTRAQAAGTTLEDDPRFTVTLTQDDRTAARTRDGVSAVAFSDVRLDIHAG